MYSRFYYNWSVHDKISTDRKATTKWKYYFITCGARTAVLSYTNPVGPTYEYVTHIVIIMNKTHTFVYNVRDRASVSDIGTEHACR